MAAAEAGAGTVHLHVRDPETGQPVSDNGIFREVCSEIKRRSDVVQCTTTGAGLGMTPEERISVVRELAPELASMNMGSINFALFPLLERISEFKFDWEKKYLESTKDLVFRHTFQGMEVFLRPCAITGHDLRWSATIWAIFIIWPLWRKRVL